VKNKKTVIIRLDSGPGIGSGHLSRCINLARELVEDEYKIYFLMGAITNSARRVCAKSGFECLLLDGNTPRSVGQAPLHNSVSSEQQIDDADRTLRFASELRPEWLIVDHYGLGDVWEQRIRSAGIRLCVIDDLARRHDCNVLVDSAYDGEGQMSARYKCLVPEDCRLFLGPQFALLGREYSQRPTQPGPSQNFAQRAFLYFGAVDSTNQTMKAIDALGQIDLTHILLDVVIGSDNPWRDDIVALCKVRGNTAIHENLSSLLPLMRRADFAVGAGGVNLWERIATGLPSVVIATAENQIYLTEKLSADNYIVTIREGVNATKTQLENTILELVSEPSRLANLRERCRTLIDGKGARRIARVLLS